MARQKIVVGNEPTRADVSIDEFVAPVEAKYAAIDSIGNEMLVEEGKILTMYTALEATLQIGDGRHEHGHIVVALDAAESNFRLAHPSRKAFVWCFWALARAQ